MSWKNSGTDTTQGSLGQCFSNFMICKNHLGIRLLEPTSRDSNLSPQVWGEEQESLYLTYPLGDSNEDGNGPI